MNNASARQTAIYTALLSAVVSSVAILVFSSVKQNNLILISIISAFLVFIAVYFISLFFLNAFIVSKIDPIYKTIQKVQFQKNEYPDEFDDSDIMNGVKEDVLHWAKMKTLEISQLKQLEKYRREFLGNVSHELKTPIFNIQGYILTLLDGALEDTGVNRDYLERAEKSINRLISIVNDLESISKLESGELTPDVKKFNIVKLVAESFEIHEMMASERNIKLRMGTKPDKPLFVIADRKKILEAMNNLIANSIKYGKKGGTTTVDFYDSGKNIRIDVTDDGIGITEKDQPRIFERFYRTEKSRSREMGGTGLGLSIVKHIIEAHQQEINVKSKKNEGSTFSFTLKKG
jgi:two-component system, OmpR family, phosphate regulon sensor histidine kinase PhoR